MLTGELVRFANPSAEAVVRQDMIDAITQFLDRQFVDPAVAEVTNVSPASITNGVTPVTATGTTATFFRADVKTLFGNFFAGNLSTVGGVWIMTQTQALSLSIMQNSLGQSVFPTISAEGGTLLGYPVVTSENIPATGNSPIDGSPIIFAKANEICFADIRSSTRAIRRRCRWTPRGFHRQVPCDGEFVADEHDRLRAERDQLEEARNTAVPIQNAKYAVI